MLLMGRDQLVDARRGSTGTLPHVSIEGAEYFDARDRAAVSEPTAR